jgi:glutaredoxin 2
MIKRCGTGKRGMTQQARLLTYIMKSMNSDSSPYPAIKSFQRAVENARQKSLTLPKQEDLMEFNTEKSYVYYAVKQRGGKLG